MNVNKQLTYKGTIINYTTTGSGYTVVLLHGFLENLTMWDEFKKDLSTNNNVVAIDLPGFGQSGIMSNNHSMSTMANAVEYVLDKENISKCVMIGHSMGGYVTLAFAELFENRLDGIILFHSQAAADDEEAKINRNRTITIVENNHAKFISGFIPSLFTEDNAIKFSSEIDQLIKSSLLTKNEGIIAALAGMRDRKDYRELLTELTIPVLFIAGKKDTRIPLEKIIQQISLPKISEALLLEDVGHMGFIEDKDHTYKSIESFVTRHSNHKKNRP